MTSVTSPPSASLPRRFFAILYDSLLLLAIWFIASAIPLIFTGGEAVKDHNLLLTIYFLTVAFFFFGWFWTHGGQTLGMRAWRLQLTQDNGATPDWPHALFRFLSGLPAWLAFIIGVAFYIRPGLELPGILRLLQNMPNGSIMLISVIWLVVDNWPNGWREKVTHTRVIQLPKTAGSTQAPEQQ